MYYNGDLRGSFLPDLRTTHFNYGGGLDFHLNNSFFLTYRYTKGSISGNDGFALSEGRRVRGLAFESPVREHSLKLGADLFNVGRKGNIRTVGYAGLGWTKFQPSQQVEGPYSLNQFSIPFGIGLNYDINRFFSLYGEITYHEMFTDYLDDVSERGNPNLGDSYVDSLIGLRIKLGKPTSGAGGLFRKKVRYGELGCPTFSGI